MALVKAAEAVTDSACPRHELAATSADRALLTSLHSGLSQAAGEMMRTVYRGSSDATATVAKGGSVSRDEALDEPAADRGGCSWKGRGSIIEELVLLHVQSSEKPAAMLTRLANEVLRLVPSKVCVGWAGDLT